jgi:hypothetical protein
VRNHRFVDEVEIVKPAETSIEKDADGNDLPYAGSTAQRAAIAKLLTPPCRDAAHAAALRDAIHSLEESAP